MPNPNAPERRILPAGVPSLKIEKRDGQPDRIIGFAAVYNLFSEDLGGFRERIAPGSFAEVIKNSDVRALVNHNPDLILGRTKAGTLTLRDTPQGLWMEIDPPDSDLARHYMGAIQRRDITGQSFAFIVGEGNDRWERDESGAVTRTITGFRDLLDVGPVVYPAYPDTSVAARSLDAFLASESREIPPSEIPAEPPPSLGRLSPSQLDALMLRLRLAEAS
jgi:hypothetical protein